MGGWINVSDVDSLDIVLGKLTGMAGLYWSTLFGLVIIFVIDMSWRLRLIHGGADAKALMWVAILIPNWSTMPVITHYDTEIVLQLPPAISLLMWGGLSFLLIPVILMGKNIFNGNVKSLSDIRMFWHSTMIDLDNVQDSHVWLLSSVIEMPNGESKPYHKKRAPRRTPTDQQLAEQIEQLRLMTSMKYGSVTNFHFWYFYSQQYANGITWRRHANGDEYNRVVKSSTLALDIFGPKAFVVTSYI